MLLCSKSYTPALDEVLLRQSNANIFNTFSSSRSPGLQRRQASLSCVSSCTFWYFHLLFLSNSIILALPTVSMLSSFFFCFMASMPVGVACMFYNFSPFRSILRHLANVCMSCLHHSLTSSSHSLAGLPLFDVPFIILNTWSVLISLLSFILHMCPNMFRFISLIICIMFFLRFNPSNHLFCYYVLPSNV